MKDLINKLTNLEATAPKAPAGKKMLTEDSNNPPMNVSNNPASLKDLFETMAAGQKPIPVVGKEGDTQQTGAGFLNITDPALQGLGKALGDLAAQKKIQMVVPTQPGQQPTSQQTGQQTGQPNQAGATGQPQQGQLAVKEKDEGKPGKNFAKIAKSAGKRYGSKAAGERAAGAVRAKLAKQGKLEEENLDELSPKTLKSYAKKADIDQVVTNRELKNRYHTGLDPDLMKQSSNRTKGMKLAGDKMMGRAKVPANEGAKVDRMVKHIEKSERKLGKSKDEAEDIAWATANKRGYLDNKNKKKTNESSETEYRVLGQYDAKTSKGYDTRPVSVKVKAASEKEAKELAKEKLAHNHKNYRPTKVETLSKKVEEGASRSLASASKKHAARGEIAINKAERAVRKGSSIESAARDFDLTPSEINRLKERVSAQNVKEADIPSSQGVDTRGAGLGAGRSQTTLEGKKPDFLDLDKDGNKKESMKKAAADKKKKKVDESMNHRISAARLEGKSHGLRGHAHCGKSYDDLEEMKAYHEGYKEGLDECYGQGVYEDAMPATVGGMADAAMDEGNAFTAALAKTPKGGKFSVGGKSFTDRTNYDAPVREADFAFEAWDRELQSLLTESETVSEGLTVSVSKGQQNSPDSVTITAQDAEADQLLQLVKHAGLGLFGDDAGHEEHPSSAMSIQPSHGEPNEVGSGGAEIDVVDDSDGMLALMKKLGGVESSGDDDEEEHTCNECGMMEAECHCDKEQVDEVETEDQMEYEVAEDNAPDSGAEDSVADEDAEAKEDADLAGSDSDDEEEMNEGFTFESLLSKMDALTESKDKEKDEEEEEEDVTESAEEDEEEEDVTEDLNEWANQVGKGPGKGTDASFEQDIEFMTKVIAGGLNKPKSTGQTTIPVIAGQDERMHDNPNDWATLAGIKK